MTKNALLALMEIICREKGIETKPNLITEISSGVKLSDKLWLGSLIEDASNWNVQLTIGGKYENDCDAWPESRSSIIKAGQHFDMDYMTKLGDKWVVKYEDQQIEVKKHLPIQYMHQLNHDQAYLNRSDTHPDLEVRIWERTKNVKIQRGSLLQLSQTTPSCGMGCNMKKNGQRCFKMRR